MARIEDYALLGDLQTAALVSRDGSVDWLCFPRFDSGACFAALLGDPDCGRWLLAPSTPATSTRRYLHDTLVLETTWTAEDGSVARVLDFMPPRGKAPDIVRIVEGVKGTVHFRSELTIRFDYGRIVPWVRKRTHEENTRVALAGPGRALFPHTRGDARRGHAHALGVRGRRGRARPVRAHVVPVARGRSRGRSIPSRRSPTPRAPGASGARSAEIDLPPEWAAVVRRSLIVLKALTYRADGRNRRRRDDVAAGMDRLRSELGLPLLLAPRRDAHPARVPAGQPRGGGDRLAALAAARRRGRSGRHPDHVRRRRRAAADRVRAAVARRLRGLEAGAGR